MIRSMSIRWAEHVARIRERERNVYSVLVAKPEGNRLLGRPRRRWENTIKIERLKMGSVDWIHLAENSDQWRTLLKTNIS